MGLLGSETTKRTCLGHLCLASLVWQKPMTSSGVAVLPSLTARDHPVPGSHAEPPERARQATRSVGEHHGDVLPVLPEALVGQLSWVHLIP